MSVAHLQNDTILIEKVPFVNGQSVIVSCLPIRAVMIVDLYELTDCHFPGQHFVGLVLFSPVMVI